jgi:tetratricopeptide (TPR) repeat protein
MQAAIDSGGSRVDNARRREQEILQRLRANPLSIRDYCALADVEIQLGDQPRALLAITEAARLCPTDPALAIRAAELHNMRANWRRAIVEYERAVRLGARDAPLIAALLLSQLGGRAMSGARRSAERLRREFPDHAVAWLAIGALCKATGDLEGASRSYRRAVQLNESLSAGWFGLVELSSPDEQAAYQDRLTDLLARAREPLDRSNLEFALARVAADSGDHARAFDAYRRANTAAAAHLDLLGLWYNPEQAEEEVQALARAHLRQSPNAFAPAPAPVTPIFIVGMPRSGSTLIEQMLSNHPHIAGGGELVALSELFDQYALAQQSANGALDDAAHGALLASLREQYIERLLEAGARERFVTDKFPGNFRLLGFARQLFPQAPVLHSRRDPMATCWSIFSTNLTLHSPYHTSLRHIGHFYEQYDWLMAHWRRTMPFLDIDYARLIDDPQRTVREMLSYCGLDFDERCLKPEQNDQPVTTASAVQVRRPLYRSALNQWRNYEVWLQPLRDALSSHESS